MLIDSTMLARLSAEIAEWALGAPIRRVIQPRHDLLALELGRSGLSAVASAKVGPRRCLLIDWSAEFCRIHLAPELPAPSSREHRLGAVLRRHLTGARLAEIAQINYDRVVQLRFTNCEHLGPQSRRALIAELMGRRSNLILVDESGVIVDAGKHITDRVNRYRQVMPGLAYVAPPDFDRLSPVDADPALLSRLAGGDGDQQLAAWLRASFHGCSDLFLAEVCARAGLDPESQLGALPPAWERPLTASLREIPAQAAALSESYVYYDEEGLKPELAYPLELACLAGRRREPVPTLSEGLAQLEGDLAAHRAMRDLRGRLSSALADALARAERVVMHRQQAVRRAREADLDRRRGEALLAHLHELPAGQREVTLAAFDDQGGELTIPLDPSLSPQDNAQLYFRGYRKAARLKDLAPRLLAAARHDLEYLRQAQTQFELAENLEDLRRIEEELVAEGYLRPPREPPARPVSAARPPGPRTTQTADGHALLYGRTGTENDAVLRAARPDDWWFHVRGAPGAHVVLRTDSRPERVPEASLVEAARLAAQLSARRSEGKVEVDYTLAKHVTKPRGGRPGLAYYTGARTVVVEFNRS